MLKNVGRVDRTFRVIIGIMLLVTVVIGEKTYWGFLGFYPLLSAILGYCPIYHILSFSDYSREEEEAGLVFNGSDDYQLDTFKEEENQPHHHV